MKPTSPIDLEMVFLRDVERRLGYALGAVESGRSPKPELLGIQGVLNNRIAEVARQREENANVNTNDVPQLQ